MRLVKLLITSAIIAGLTFFPFPHAQAVPTVDPANASLLGILVGKETIADPIARAIAYKILKAVSDSVMRKIASSGTGRVIITGTNLGPAFVQNWRKFILEGQYRGESIWRGILDVAANGDSSLGVPPLLCDHIRNSSVFKSLLPQNVPNLIQSRLNRRVDSLQEYLVTTRCDPSIDHNYDVFLNDFNAGGGWDMFEKLSQPQNNIYGALGLAMTELGKQRSLEEKADINEVTSAKGFTGLRTGCVSNSSRSSRCTILGEIVTPGDILGESAVQAINQNFAFIANADEINEVIVTVIGALIDRVFSGGGLTQNTDLGELVLPGQEIPQPQAPAPPPSPNCQLEKILGTENFNIVCN